MRSLNKQQLYVLAHMRSQRSDQIVSLESNNSARPDETFVKRSAQLYRMTGVHNRPWQQDVDGRRFIGISISTYDRLLLCTYMLDVQVQGPFTSVSRHLELLVLVPTA